MKLCSRCNKNIATVFLNKMENGKEVIEQICIKCAKDVGIPGIETLIKQSGMSEEEFDSLLERADFMIENMDIDNMNLEGMMDVVSGLATGQFDPHEQFETVDMSTVESEDVQMSSDAKFNKEKSGASTKQKTKKKLKLKKRALDTYGVNLTIRAMSDEIDPIIGRNREVDRMVQILNRRTKNNPVLIGAPGVGKTAIAEGLAMRIAQKQVPAKLFSSQVYLLDMTAVVAGTQFRGQFESRMQSIIKEASEIEGVILVIDEIHNIIGAGDPQGGVMNAANILKPALSRGQVQIVGATTLEEYRKYIEKDSALERRFQPIIIEEPSVEESIEILKGIRHKYEAFHKVRISDDVLEACVRLSDRYIRDRYLPDKAIDVMDEAGSRANLKNQGLVELTALYADLEKVKLEKHEAAELEDYERSADLKMQEISIETKIKDLEKETIFANISTDDIAYVIEAWTKIPVQKITQKEASKLLSLEKNISSHVIGQDDAVAAVAKAVRRNRSGFRKLKKPSSFIFVGPTGVGKTELAKRLAIELFGTEQSLIRLDMSEYMERHTVSKLIGAPPGYVGFDQGEKLTDIVRRRPYSVILLDEIEKAHSDIFNILLQILDDGRLTDSQGRTVFFDNTVLIMTSNLGTDKTAGRIGFGFDEQEGIDSKVRLALEKTFRPEFLNRLDSIVIFKKLKKSLFNDILDIMLKDVKSALHEKNMSMKITDLAKEFLIDKGYSDLYGARPMRRVIQDYLEDEISDLFLRGGIKEGNCLFIDVERSEEKLCIKLLDKVHRHKKITKSE